MVHGFAAQTGGALVLRSTVGQGTSAEIWLPVAPAQTEPEGTAEADHDDEPPARERRLSILAVDDDVLVLTNTVMMLEDLGHEVVQARSAPEALREAGRRSFDLVITDHAMPQQTGLQLVAELRRKTPDLPVILATGYADLPPGAVNGLLRLGKPFSGAELRSVIARAMAPELAG
jgi:CheY-like chemotaxis protein